MDTKKFIKKARKIHGDKYDYSKVEYINAHTKVCIVCPIHGEFWQTPNNHTNKTKPKGCPKCAGKLVTDTESFIKEARKIHGDKYDYSKVEYVNTMSKVCIICPIHGEFLQTPNKHLSGNNCPKCSHQSYLHTTDSFIKEARKIHGDKYDYSKVRYINAHTKVCIICPIHGEFWQLPTNHLRGKRCQKCRNEEISINNKSSKEEFIQKSKKIHGDKYDYSKVEYINSQTKVCIICPKHGEFWQKPNAHLSGKGCRLCKESHLEREMRIALINSNIIFSIGSHFTWLGRQHLDFYLPEYNIAIECQGEQHFIKANKFNRKRTLDEIISQDVLKNKLCKTNNVKLIYYTSPLIDSLAKKKNKIYENTLFTSTDSVLQKIRDT